MGRRTAAVVIALLLGLTTVAACGSNGSDEATPLKGGTTLTAGGLVTSAIVRQPESDCGPDALPTVLFLHGQAYTSKIWSERGILDAVADACNRAVAIDLPGYGDTPERPDGDGADPVSDGAWLRSVVDELGGPENVVIVSPSMSGTYSLGYLTEFPDDELKGFVPIAPTTVDATRDEDAAEVPTMIVWGEDDDKPVSEADDLAEQFPDSTIEVIPDGSHAPYDDEPKAFLDVLLPFLERVQS